MSSRSPSHRHYNNFRANGPLLERAGQRPQVSPTRRRAVTNSQSPQKPVIRRPSSLGSRSVSASRPASHPAGEYREGESPNQQAVLATKLPNQPNPLEARTNQVSSAVIATVEKRLTIKFKLPRDLVQSLVDGNASKSRLRHAFYSHSSTFLHSVYAQAAGFQNYSGSSSLQPDPFTARDDPMSRVAPPPPCVENGRTSNHPTSVAVAWDTAYETNSLPGTIRTQVTQAKQSSKLSLMSPYRYSFVDKPQGIGVAQSTVPPSRPSPSKPAPLPPLPTPAQLTTLPTPSVSSVESAPAPASTSEYDYLFDGSAPSETPVHAVDNNIAYLDHSDDSDSITVATKRRQSQVPQARRKPITLGSPVTDEESDNSVFSDSGQSDSEDDIPIIQTKRFLSMRGGQVTSTPTESMSRELINLNSSPLKWGPSRDRDRIYLKDLLDIDPGDFTYPIELEKPARKKIPDWEEIECQEGLEEKIEEALASSTVNKPTPTPTPRPSGPAPSPLLAELLDKAITTIDASIKDITKKCREVGATDTTAIEISANTWLRMCREGKEQFEQVCEKQKLLPSISFSETCSLAEKHPIASSPAEMEDRVGKKAKMEVRVIELLDSDSD